MAGRLTRVVVLPVFRRHWALVAKVPPKKEGARSAFDRAYDGMAQCVSYASARVEEMDALARRASRRTRIRRDAAVKIQSLMRGEVAR